MSGAQCSLGTAGGSVVRRRPIPARPNPQETSMRSRKVVAALCVVVAIAVTMSSSTSAACGTTCKERVARQKCSQAQPVWCIERAIMTHRLPAAGAAWMRRVARCESGLSPYAKNPSGSSGLFQFMPSTWARSGYGHHSIWSAKWQSLAAASFYRQGRTGEWVCR